MPTTPSRPRPAPPLPPPIRSAEPGTWSHSTITERLPEIARRTLRENAFIPPVQRQVQALGGAIPYEGIRQLRQDAPDAAAWAAYTTPYVGRDWLTVPWFFAETYFYRRLLEATTYFEQGPGYHQDPFKHQKEQGLLTTLETTGHIASQLAQHSADDWQPNVFAELLAIDLWANRADLSLWPADEGGDRPQEMDWDTAVSHTLVDDTAQALAHLQSRQPARVDILIDNAGIELVADLALVDYLLSKNAAHSMLCHLKLHPTFVSDALISDVRATVAFLAAQEDRDIAAFGRRLQAYLDNGRLQLQDHPFWVSPLPFWEMPAALRADLGRADLILSKGDANYRRLLGDRQWPYTTPFTAILQYTPAPLLALRALKAELAAGLAEAQIAQLDRDDPGWLTNGLWAVIQFAEPATAP